ncbi:MAG: S-methyl-5-thioribose-1-phosphate isomerase [Sedimentisphaerales bacterium]|nr:S-methyl-5-thioribose-1-phosphate isomerase [Sedimentisphaerales bacterium]
MKIRTLEWIDDIDGFLRLIDQRVLPQVLPRRLVYLDCHDVPTLAEAIRKLAVRGAPAIGIAAGYGMCLAAQKIDKQANLSDALQILRKQADILASSRPTAVNLFWALDRMMTCASRFLADNPGACLVDVQKGLLSQARSIHIEDQEMCRSIGEHGRRLIPEGGSVLTHCNAGALATGGIGTALAPMYVAHEQGKRFHVYVDETRPLLQGARLTAWELLQAGIDVTLICDNMAGMLMKQRKIDAVITGADRIAANGDTANKIGTYSLSILAAAHNVPFYIAAPSSTFDLKLAGGEKIPIEQRSPQEITSFGDRLTAPEDIKVYNPAFDVVDASKITAIITEKGIIEYPDTDKIAAHLGHKGQ